MKNEELRIFSDTSDLSDQSDVSDEISHKKN